MKNSPMDHGSKWSQWNVEIPAPKKPYGFVERGCFSYERGMGLYGSGSKSPGGPEIGLSIFNMIQWLTQFCPPQEHRFYNNASQ